MYSKHEAAKLKHKFWTAFGLYMSPVLSSEKEHINWINYKTGEKNIYFRMHADSKKASVAIEITHADEDVQALYFKQFHQLKTLLQNALNEEWKWQLHTQNETGKTISRIYVEINNVNVFNKHNWPQLISFFKPRIIALDEFWSSSKYAFGILR